MRTDDLHIMLRSKRDLFTILTLEGQFYLPTFDNCTLYFLQQCLMGKKRLLRMCEVKQVSVPRYTEFSQLKLYDMAI